MDQGQWEYHVRPRLKGRFCRGKIGKHVQLHVRSEEGLRVRMREMANQRKMTLGGYAALAIGEKIRRDEARLDQLRPQDGLGHGILLEGEET